MIVTTSIQDIKFADFSLSLFVPNQQQIQQLYLQQKLLDANTPFPYWAKVWASSIGLSYFLNSNQQYIKNKTILELAAGLGLPSLVAAKWASHVCCSDYLQVPLNVVEASAKYNQLQNITCSLINWFAMPRNIAADVLLLSDINYEPNIFTLLLRVIKSFLTKGTTVILSTPQRLLAKPFIEQLLPFCTLQQEVEVTENGTRVWIQIMVLQA